MANNLILQGRLSVGTVDSFQGQERGISAITLTRSTPQGEIGFLSDIRRMNVGMTRARRKLLLVGDSSTLCRHPFFVELLAYVKGVGGYRTARILRTQQLRSYHESVPKCWRNRRAKVSACNQVNCRQTNFGAHCLEAFIPLLRFNNNSHVCKPL